MERTEQNIVKFSYDLVLSLKKFPGDDAIYWEVIEKGSEKTDRLKYIISFIAIDLARDNLSPLIISPCYKSSLLRDEGFDIYLKRDQHHPLQSVKGRGVIYTLLRLSGEQRSKGVIAISTGSFAFILCYYGNMYNIPVTVVMPTTVADDHVKKCRDTGSLAAVFVYGNDIIEAHSYALELAQLRGLFYLDGNDHPYMIIGQTTLGLEIKEEMKDVDVVILPTAIDNCGLTTAMATAIKEADPKITIFEVKSTDYDPLVEKIRSQTKLEHELTIPVAKYLKLNSSKPIFDYHIKTNKGAILAAAKILHETESFSDYYAAIGLAPIVGGELNTLKGKRVVIPVFGEMDSTMGFSTLISSLSPSVPRAGPSTLRE